MWNGCWKKPKNNAGAIMAAALFFERIEAMRHFYHLTHDDRIKIEALLKEKHTPKEIANNIGCHISTIYREDVYKRQAGKHWRRMLFLKVWSAKPKRT